MQAAPALSQARSASGTEDMPGPVAVAAQETVRVGVVQVMSPTQGEPASMADHNLAQALEEVEEALPEQAAMRLMAGQTVPIRAMAAPQLRVAALGATRDIQVGRLYLDRAAVAVPPAP